jgi:hypothetical protein
MKVIIGTEEFKKSSSFVSITNCPLAVALRKLLGPKEIRVGGFTISIEGIDYSFKGWSETWCQSEADKVNEYIADAKAGKETPTFEIEILDYKN